MRVHLLLIGSVLLIGEFISTLAVGDISTKIEAIRRKRFTHEAATNKTEFWLYTRNNPEKPDYLEVDNTDSIKNSNFNIKWPIRVLIHGFRSKGTSSFNQVIKDAYLQKGDFNVIVVHWGALSSDGYNYNDKALSIKHIGLVVADFLKYLNSKFSVSFDNVYLIGHSLGAHIAGFVGSFVAPGRVNTIFALDPAGPYFENADPSDRVDKTDANYVESIQTNTNLLGMSQPVGHAAFYPNFGQHQEGCAALPIGCSHKRTYKYFAESINRPFMARPCLNYEEIKNSECSWPEWDVSVQMGGEPSQTNRNGIFYAPIEVQELNGKKLYGKGFEIPREVLSMKLYTPENPNAGVAFSTDNLDDLKKHTFKQTRLTKVIVCPYSETPKSCESIKDKILQNQNFNVFVLDTTKIQNYKKTLFGDDIGRFIAKFQHELISNFPYQFARIELMAKSVKSKTVPFAKLLLKALSAKNSKKR